ncbi:AraC family transcriptional regulator [Mycolicibacterium sp. YH-1]|uniref:AraC family transcriptional regulator n=1 Tax=Mycolicibacterium sp. YH-1 TaxID=2908837 RepID=UPI001F4C0EDC|nr:AraC family transcriptional regulator [Mycolicibacterium sp. YH-1]UNB56369.1 AraC family transcriptional regulator [Mycolicibacterium sp. YH-1]
MVSLSDLEFDFISEQIAKPTDWVFDEPHHVIAIYTGGLVRAKETEFDRGPLHRDLPKVGDILVIPAGQHVGITAQGRLAEFSQVNVPTKLLEHRELTPRFGYRDSLLHQMTRRVQSVVDREDLLARLLKESLTDVVRLHLSDHYAMIQRRRTTRTFDLATQVRLVEFIEDSLDEDISIAALSEFTGMSANSFITAFVSSFHTTPYQFVLTRRINRAKFLLASTAMSITDIGVAAGFSTPSHFATTFKSRVGATPTAYRSGL